MNLLLCIGEWCHVFPEGGIWQTDTLGGRSNGREAEVGKLKWGVGKLIAHAPVTPLVRPFFFMGTETAYPQHPETKANLNGSGKLRHVRNTPISRTPKL